MFFNKFIKSKKFKFSFFLIFFCACFLLTLQAVACTKNSDCASDEICEGGDCVVVQTENKTPSTTDTGLEEAANIAGLGKPSLPSLIGRFVQGTLSFVGVIFLILMVYGGFLWMTAGGNEEHVTKAKKLIMSATIGLFIVIGAYAITYYLTSVLLEAAKVE